MTVRVGVGGGGRKNPLVLRYPRPTHTCTHHTWPAGAGGGRRQLAGNVISDYRGARNGPCQLPCPSSIQIALWSRIAFSGRLFTGICAPFPQLRIVPLTASIGDNNIVVDNLARVSIPNDGKLLKTIVSLLVVGMRLFEQISTGMSDNRGLFFGFKCT